MLGAFSMAIIREQSIKEKSHGDNNKKKTSPSSVLPKSPVLNVRLLAIKTFLIEGLTSE